MSKKCPYCKKIFQEEDLLTCSETGKSIGCEKCVEEIATSLTSKDVPKGHFYNDHWG